MSKFVIVLLTVVVTVVLIIVSSANAGGGGDQNSLILSQTADLQKQIDDQRQQIESLKGQLEAFKIELGINAQNDRALYFSNEPGLKLKAASTLLKNGEEDAARALAVGAVGQIFGRKLFDCGDRPTMISSHFGALISKADLNQLLMGSGFEVVASASNGELIIASDNFVCP